MQGDIKMITVTVYISLSWMNSNGDDETVYLVELDKNQCLANKYTYRIDKCKTQTNNYPQGYYKITYDPTNLQEYFAIPLVSLEYLGQHKIE